MGRFTVKLSGPVIRERMGHQEKDEYDRCGVLICNGKPVGEFEFLVSEPGTVHVHWFAIEGPYRHRGYGRALWNLLERKFQQYYKAKKITLFYKDKRARLFWKAVGFKHAGSKNYSGQYDALKLLPKINSKSNIKPLASRR